MSPSWTTHSCRCIGPVVAWAQSAVGPAPADCRHYTHFLTSCGIDNSLARQPLRRLGMQERERRTRDCVPDPKVQGGGVIDAAWEHKVNEAMVVRNWGNRLPAVQQQAPSIFAGRPAPNRRRGCRLVPCSKSPYDPIRTASGEGSLPAGDPPSFSGAGHTAKPGSSHHRW
jgi:hypothetical protein